MSADWFGTTFEPQSWDIGISLFLHAGVSSGWLMFVGLTLSALLPDVLLEAWKVCVRPSPLQVQMYHDRQANKSRGFFPSQYRPSSSLIERIAVLPKRSAVDLYSE